MSRQISYPTAVNLGNGLVGLAYFNRRDNFPLVTSTFSGDTTIFKQFGPISGHRYDVTTAYAPDIKDLGTLTRDFTVDARQYFQVTSRSLLAARLFAGYSTGNFPNLYYFGGLNTLRGYDFRSIVGTRAGFANLEYRFPLILAASWMSGCKRSVS